MSQVSSWEKELVPGGIVVWVEWSHEGKDSLFLGSRAVMVNLLNDKQSTVACMPHFRHHCARVCDTKTEIKKVLEEEPMLR